jgi:hypothetical protein
MDIHCNALEESDVLFRKVELVTVFIFDKYRQLKKVVL